MLRKPDSVRYTYIVVALSVWWLFWIGWMVARRVRTRRSATPLR